MEIIKHKFLVLNDNYEILTFLREGENGKPSKLFFPKIEEGEEQKYAFSEEIMEVLRDLGVTPGDSMILQDEEAFSINRRYRCVNNKLIAERDKFITNYYFTFASFDEESVRKINEICSRHGFLPYFLGIEELEHISSDDLERSENSLGMDHNVTSVVRKLKRAIK